MGAAWERPQQPLGTDVGDNFLCPLFKAKKESFVHQRPNTPKGRSWSEQVAQHTLLTAIAEGTASPWLLGTPLALRLFLFKTYKRIRCFDETLQIISHAGE